MDHSKLEPSSNNHYSSSRHLFTNHLVHETSPYLLQHAHNPVNWYAWGEAALSAAIQQDKPILISIGYAACHWCHVMERESFEDQSVAAYMNEHFINIKVDREERPDLDHLYMDALQAMTGQGGWPLNVFLLPDTRPFFGGTYFPPQRLYQRPSWKEVLESIVYAYHHKKEDLITQADNLTQHLEQQNTPLTIKSLGEEQMDSVPQKADFIRAAILQTADKKWGGFGRAPKFPQSFTIRYLLRDYYYTGASEGLDQAILSLDKMIQGGIYDQVGGGFSRYSTDEKWLAPHFEKMLYDNALLLEALAEAYSLTKEDNYKRAITQTVEFLIRELQHPEGSFYAALDADSEGIEGKYYVWQRAEIEQILGPEAELFCLLYDIEQVPNWEHGNILWLQESIQQVAKNIKVAPQQLITLIEKSSKKLLKARHKRVAPITDDKILLSWNALMITALCKCSRATKDQSFIAIATKCYQFLDSRLKQSASDSTHYWMHHWNKRLSDTHAFLDDYAFLIQAHIELNAVTGDPSYIDKASELTQLVVQGFSDEANNFFYFTHKDSGALVRKLETYDNATPSGNAVMADNLLRLSLLLDKPDWRQRALYMIETLEPIFSQYPTAMGYWATLWQKIAFGTPEIAIIGENATELAQKINAYYIPGATIQHSSTSIEDNPLLRGKKVPKGQTFIYLCQNYQCSQPVSTPEAFMELLTQSGIHYQIQRSDPD